MKYRGISDRFYCFDYERKSIFKTVHEDIHLYNLFAHICDAADCVLKRHSGVFTAL